MSNEIVRIPFHGQNVEAIDIDGKPFVIFKPIVESIRLDWSSQIAKLRTRSWTNRRDIPTVAADGKTRIMAAVDVPTLLMWLATVNEAKVAEEARPLLIAYQRESADAINDYWTKGAAINTRATEDQLVNVINRCKGQVDVLAALRGIVDPKWLESKARHVAARALGEEPEEDLLSRPLTVGEYLEDKGVKDAALRKMSMPFGKRLVTLYVGEHGSAPGKNRRFINGAQRDVYVYTEGDRQLFDLVWDDMTAGVLL